MHETHYDYFLKDLKKTLPQLLKHRKNAPIILISNKEYIQNTKDLIDYILQKLNLISSYLVSDYAMEDFERYFSKYVSQAEEKQKQSLE